MDSNNPYFEILKSFFEKSGVGLTTGMFRDFSRELSSIFIQDIGRVIKDSDEDVSDFVKDLNETITAIRRKKGEAVISFMPAGSYAVSIAGKVKLPGVRISAFYDNYKEEGKTADGVPVLRPLAAKGMPFDLLVIATPSYGAQRAMKKQMEEITSAKIISSGDTILKRKLAGIDELTEVRANEAARRINELETEAGQKKILFAMPTFPAHYITTIRALRRKGHKVILLSNSPEIMYGPKIDEFSPEFDLIHTTENNLLEFFKIIRKTKADALYAVDYSLYNYLGLLIRDVWQGKMYFEVYDMSDNVAFAKGQGIKTVESGMRLSMDALEDHARPLLYEKVEGIIYRDSPELMERVRGLYKTETKAVQFFPYPEKYDKLKELDGAEHVVFCGHILQVKEDLVYTMLDMAKETARQGIHMHIYNPADPSRSILKEYIELAVKTPYFHYHRPIPHEELNYVMRKYNWGWLVYDFTGRPEEDMPRYHTTFTSRLLSYVAAGLPSICSEENRYQADIIKKYGIGIVIGKEDIPNLSKILKNADYKQMCKNTLSLRDEWDIDNKIDELVNFLS